MKPVAALLPTGILAGGGGRLVAKCKCLLPEAIVEIILGCKLQDKQTGLFLVVQL